MLCEVKLPVVFEQDLIFAMHVLVLDPFLGA